jgi:hypothetical protein
MKISPSRTISTTTAVFLIVACLTLLTASTACAQGFAHLSGTVTDASGAAVPNARIVGTRVSTNDQTTVQSGSDGSYVFPSLPPAEYNISVSASGFSSFIQHNIILQADQAVTVNVALKVGATSQTVDVSAAPPQIDTTTGTLSQVIDEKRINDLPLNGRNAAALTTLVPGVVVAPSANIDQGQTKTFPVVAAVTINGTRANQVNYMLDGGNNIDEYTNVNAPFPMPDALQEFSVQTSNYNAQYGQNAGGVVNIVTDSGTNNFHGSAFEYLRNRVFNATNYFSYVNGVKTRDPLKRNQFGGTIGGPVWIPHLYDGRQDILLFWCPVHSNSHEWRRGHRLSSNAHAARRNFYRPLQSHPEPQNSCAIPLHSNRQHLHLHRESQRLQQIVAGSAQVPADDHRERRNVSVFPRRESEFHGVHSSGRPDINLEGPSGAALFLR